MRSFPVAIVMLGAGVALLFWGQSASESISSEASELFQGAPSDKTMSLMILGGVLAGLGLLSLLRRPSSS